MNKEGSVKEKVGHKGEKKEEMGGKNCTQMMTEGNKEEELVQRIGEEEEEEDYWVDKQLEGRRGRELAQTVRQSDKDTNTGGTK